MSFDTAGQIVFMPTSEIDVLFVLCRMPFVCVPASFGKRIRCNLVRILRKTLCVGHKGVSLHDAVLLFWANVRHRYISRSAS